MSATPPATPPAEGQGGGEGNPPTATPPTPSPSPAPAQPPATQPPAGDPPPGYIRADVYAGLQRTHQQTVETNRAQIAELTQTRDQALAQVADIQGQLTVAQSQLGQLQAQFDELGTQHTAMETELEATALLAERRNLILSEFPDLAPYEVRGLLPQANTPEDLRTALTDFKTAMVEIRKAGITDQASGGVPSPPPQPPQPADDTLSIEALTKKAIEAGRAGNVEEAQRLQTIIEKKAFAQMG